MSDVNTEQGQEQEQEQAPARQTRQDAIRERQQADQERRDRMSILEQLISDIRSDQSKDRKTRDNLVGELRAEIDELKNSLRGLRNAQERANRKPKDTMVTPPKPPEQAAQDAGANVDQALPPNEPPRRRSGFFEVW